MSNENELINELQNIKNDRNINLKPENLRKGITCLGVTGILEEGVDTSDANATANDIISSKTAYVDGKKITGNMISTLPSAPFMIENSTVINSPDDSLFAMSWILPEDMGNIAIVPNTNIIMIGVYSNIAEAIGLTADKIKKDEIILGITGTLEEALEINPTNTFADDTAKQLYDIQAAYDNMQPRILTNTDKEINKSIYCIPTKLDGTSLLDTSNVVDMNSMFYNCSNLLTIPLLDTSNVTNMYSMFSNCYNLREIPLLDTSNVINMGYMFYKCNNLQKIPLLNTENVTSMYCMFTNCLSLINDSLNNILASLTNATKTTSNKTLKYIGLSQEQATTCTTLSNWAACETAGWTTGY